MSTFITSPDWQFNYDPNEECEMSSGRKRIVRGTYEDRSAFGRKVDARALEFVGDHGDLFGAECAALAKANAVGVGPRLLQTTKWVHQCSIGNEKGFSLREPAHTSSGELRLDVDDLPISFSFDLDDVGRPRRSELSLPVIIEEDVGISLADAIFQHRGVPGPSDTDCSPLGELGSDERSIENAKIKFDVMAQLMNLHANGLYHRDLRADNVCVRRIGREPQDIRATLIDFELMSPLSEHAPKALSTKYYKTMFRRGQGPDAKLFPSPNPIEQDLGLLTALFYELDHEERAWDAGAELLDGSLYQHFVNSGHGYFNVRALRPSDLSPYAEAAKLTPVNESSLGSPEAVDLANRLIKHGGYLDKRDWDELHDEPMHYILMERSRLAVESYATYVEQRKSEGRKVEYATFDEQPVELKDQNYDLIASYPMRLARFGYQLAPASKVPANARKIDGAGDLPDEVFEEMSEDEHNRWWALKEKQGWSLWDDGPIEEYKKNKRRHDAEKRNAWMRPYEELPEDMREYDRKNVRNMFEFLKLIGLAVYRP